MRWDWVFIGILSLALGVLAGTLLPRVQAEEPCGARPARYQIAGTGGEIAYRVDTYTGEVVIISPHGYMRRVELEPGDP